MKRCPECRRGYYDDSLLYCLDDGSALLEGPANSEPPAMADGLTPPSTPSEEPRTAIFPSVPGSEAATRAHISAADPVPETNSGARRPKVTRTMRPLLAVAAAAVLLFAGFITYRYLGSAATKQINSIAVMPFANESGDASLEYLSDGMTETLMNSLAQLPGLTVKARGSTFRYKGKDFDPQTVASELGVQRILNGRIVETGGDLTVFLELVDAGTGDRVWGERYSRPISGIVALQNDIARDVSLQLKSRITGDEQQRVAKNYTNNSEAYQLYLQGRYFWNKRTPDGFRVAIPYFEKARALDPNYALAHTGLADSYALLAIYEVALPRDTMPKAKQEALVALSMDPNLAEAHASLGQVLQNYEYDFTGAEREYKKAIELNPNYASAHQWYGELLANVGRFDESVASLNRALELDPFSLVINRMKGSSLVYAGKWDEGLEQMKKTVAMDPRFPGVHYDLFLVNQLKGNYAAAVEEFARWRELNGDRVGAERTSDSFAKGGWRGFLLAMIRDNESFRTFHHYHMVVFYTALGDKDGAIKELSTAYDQRENDIDWMKVDPRLAPLRDDPRFREILTKVGFPSTDK